MRASRRPASDAIRLRPATRDDLDAVVEIEKRAFDHDIISRRSLRRFLTASSAVAIVAEHQGKVADKKGETVTLAGQVTFMPIEESLNGTIVFDGTIWPPDEIGLLSELVRLTVKDGIIRPTDEEHARTAGPKLVEYLDAELDRRAASGETRDDLIDEFLAAEVDGHRLTREDIIDIMFLLVLAGLDTVTSSLSCMVDWLARHPDYQDIIDQAALDRINQTD